MKRHYTKEQIKKNRIIVGEIAGIFVISVAVLIVGLVTTPHKKVNGVSDNAIESSTEVFDETEDATEALPAIDGTATDVDLEVPDEFPSVSDDYADEAQDIIFPEPDSDEVEYEYYDESELDKADADDKDDELDDDDEDEDDEDDEDEDDDDFDLDYMDEDDD